MLQAIVVYGSVYFPPARPSPLFAGEALLSLVAAGLLAWAPRTGSLLGATVLAGLNVVPTLWALPAGAEALAVPLLVLLGYAGFQSYRAWHLRRMEA